MEFNDYLEMMEFTDISYSVVNWKHTGFAMENDDTPINRKSVFRGDPREYNKHLLQLKSSVKQKIVLSMHQYHWKHYHGQCSYYFS